MTEEETQELPCATQYPLVLIHGIGFLHRKFPNYWGRIPKHLERNGAVIFYANKDEWGSLENNAAKI